MIKFWAKILTGKNTKISHKIYKLLLYLHNNNIYSFKWISCIQKTLQDVGLNYIWISNNIENINWLCREVKSRLEMQFVQNGIPMSKPAQNALVIEFSKQILKSNPILQNFNPVPLSPYLDSEQQIIDFLWNGVDGRMLTVHKDSVIFVRETCLATNSTICLNINSS